MRSAGDLPSANTRSHPNPLASHAPAPAGMNGSATTSPRHDFQHTQDMETTTSRPGSAISPNASPTSTDIEEHARPVRPSSISTQGARPSFLRAKSDFGPRHPSLTPDNAPEGSVDGHFKIRHGWDDQLNSEEYSNLLTSVRATTPS